MKNMTDDQIRDLYKDLLYIDLTESQLEHIRKVVSADNFQVDMGPRLGVMYTGAIGYLMGILSGNVIRGGD